MIDECRVGVGIITYNRKDKFKRLFDEVNSNSDVDEIVVVKNKDVDYLENSPEKLVDQKRSHYIHVSEDLGVGYCKNQALKKLLDDGCQQLFLVEDDINIKNPDVFKMYIGTARFFKLQHMNFCQAWDHANQKFIRPIYCIRGGSYDLDVSFRLCGDFSYFTSDILKRCGLFDAVDYVNALEHIEHTYRITLAGGTLPFYAFADIHDSVSFIEDTGLESSILKNDQGLYNQRLMHAFQKFVKTYGRTINQIPIPSQREVVEFLQKMRA